MDSSLGGFDDSARSILYQGFDEFQKFVNPLIAQRAKLSGEPNPLFAEVRGSGFMLGVQLRQPTHPWLSFEHFGWPELAHQPTIGPLLCHRLYRRGFFAFVCGHDWSILRLQPRFDIEEARLTEFASACQQELAELAALS